jgi:hypothetical protein
MSGFSPVTQSPAPTTISNGQRTFSAGLERDSVGTAR